MISPLEAQLLIASQTEPPPPSSLPPFFPFSFFELFLCGFMLTKSLRYVLCVFVCVEKDHFACVRILYSMCFSSWIFGNYPLYFDAISSHEFWTRVPRLKLSWNVISSFALCYTGFIFSLRNKNSDQCWLQALGVLTVCSWNCWLHRLC